MVAVQVHVDHAMPLGKVVVHVEEGLDRGDPGIVDEHIDVPESGEGLAHGAPDRVAVGNVALDEEGIAAPPPEVRDRRRALFRIHVEDRHPRSSLGEGLADARSDTAAPTRDDHIEARDVHRIPQIGDGVAHRVVVRAHSPRYLRALRPAMRPELSAKAEESPDDTRMG